MELSLKTMTKCVYNVMWSIRIRYLWKTNEDNMNYIKCEINMKDTSEKKQYMLSMAAFM